MMDVTFSVLELNQFLPDVWKADSLTPSPTGEPSTASQSTITE
jgi:hypothetical protein